MASSSDQQQSQSHQTHRQSDRSSRPSGPAVPTRRGRLSRLARPVRRPAAGLGLVAVLVAGLTGTAAADPTGSATSAPPTVASVTNALADLGRQNEALSEQINAATIDVAAKQAAATAATATATQAEADWQASLRRFGSTIVEQYKNGQLSRGAALLTSRSTQDYLNTLSDLATVSAHNTTVVDQLSAARTAADTARTAAATALAEAATVRDGLAAQQKKIQAQQASYQRMLATLTPAQQTTFHGRDTAAVPAAFSVHAGSAAAQTAIDFALAQRGKPYVYGASGPNSYDCSGLTAAAWAAAGVSLPHQSAQQYNYGTHVSLSALQPGDLVFFYSPISHVAIYLGNGLIVHAPTSGDVVKVSPMFSGAVGATRLT